jgi:hypothetical protein
LLLLRLLLLPCLAAAQAGAHDYGLQQVLPDGGLVFVVQHRRSLCTSQ